MRDVGLTPAQHQLLLAVKGHRGAPRPDAWATSPYLMRRHHSTVELIDRAEAAGLVERWGDDTDGRVTRVRLTAEGEVRLARLAPAHLDELRNLAPCLTSSWPSGLARPAADPAVPAFAVRPPPVNRVSIVASASAARWMPRSASASPTIEAACARSIAAPIPSRAAPGGARAVSAA